MSTDPTEPQEPNLVPPTFEAGAPRPVPAEIPGYQVRKFLGSGAYGEVWTAVDKTTGRLVAIKFFTHPGGVNWSLLRSEVEKLAFLSANRYVVQVLDVGWQANPPFYVMEFIENGSLKDRIERFGPLPVETAVEMFKDLVTGISHAHGKGVLHCDLKPANILLDQELKPRIADFGQSRLTTEQTPSLGTLFYMPPEQADLSAIPDSQWDIYALGAILYTMLTGDPPYRTEQSIEAIDSSSGLAGRLEKYRRLISDAELPTKHRTVKGVDSALKEIVDRCLALNPARRFPNAFALLQSLRSRERRRNRRPLILLGLLGPLLLLVTTTLFGLRAYQQSIEDTKASLTQRAGESNQFAARFVARTVSEKIADRFREVLLLAESEPFRQLVVKLVDDPALETMLSGLVDPEESGARQAAIDELQRSAAQQHLQRWLSDAMNNPKTPTVASWFVVDARGTQLAASYTRAPEKSVVGHNFSYRTYFHGGDRDLPDDQRTAEHITEPHLSAVFQSTASATWKVALSAPIYEADRFLGIVAATVEIGEFARFERSSKQFAVLIDGRDGDHRGVILQHPLFDSLIAKNEKIPDRFSDSGDFLVHIDALAAEEAVVYLDPLGRDPLGKDYVGKWIAAAAPVQLPKNDTFVDTGLWVVVQESYNLVTEPAAKLGQQLLNEGVTALSVFLGMSGLMWFWVFRTARSNRRFGGKDVETADTFPSIHERETLQQPMPRSAPPPPE